MKTFLSLLWILPLIAAGQIPQTINHQGRVAVGGVNFTGTGQFKFALVDKGVNLNETATAFAMPSGGVLYIYVNKPGSGYVTPPAVTITSPTESGGAATAVLTNGSVSSITVTSSGTGYNSSSIQVTIAPPPPAIENQVYWSNAGDLGPNGIPEPFVSLPVSNGLYSVPLGGADMSPFNLDIFGQPLFLRVWFNDGVHGFQQLTPDQPLSSAPSSFVSQLALGVPPSSIGSFQIVDGAVGSSKLATGATAASLNAGGNQAVTLGAGTFTGPLAVGTGNVVNGIRSVAFGQGSDAEGINSLAIGENTTASGRNSFAGGKGSIAQGSQSLAFGTNTLASGQGALAIGLENNAVAVGALACGSYNSAGVSSLFSVGNGDSSANRKNAFLVSSSGSAFLQTNLSVGDSISYGGSLTHSSDARLKDIGAPYERGLEAISGIETIHYHFKKDNAKKLPSDNELIGVTAQQLRTVLPEAVVEDSDGYLAVQQDPVLWALVNSVKELKAENDALKQRLEKLEKQTPAISTNP